MAELHPKSHPPTSPMSSDSSVRSVERAIDVLFSFTQQEPVLDIPALQQRTGLSRPTLYRLLGTLESSGLIYSFGNPRRFQLGARTGLLASTWTPAPPLVTLGDRKSNRMSTSMAHVWGVSGMHTGDCWVDFSKPVARDFSV